MHAAEAMHVTLFEGGIDSAWVKEGGSLEGEGGCSDDGGDGAVYLDQLWEVVLLFALGFWVQRIKNFA